MGVIGTAVGTKVGSTIKVRVGSTVNTVQVARDLTVADGDLLLMESVNSRYYAHARVQVAAPAPRNNQEDDNPDPNPKTTTGSDTFPPIETRTWTGKWRTDSTDVWQGNFSGNGIGTVFYGKQMKSLKGATILKASFEVIRINGGIYTPETTTMRLVTQLKKPSGAPTLTSTATGPTLNVTEEDPSFDVPNSWITSMANGTAGGIAFYDSGGSPYVRFAGRGTYQPAFSLTVDWKRTS